MPTVANQHEFQPDPVFGPYEADYGDDQMNEKDDDIAHPGMLSNSEKHLILPQLSNSRWTRTGAIRDCLVNKISREAAASDVLGPLPNENRLKKIVVREAQSLTRSAILIGTPPRSMLR